MDGKAKPSKTTKPVPGKGRQSRIELLPLNRYLKGATKRVPSAATAATAAAAATTTTATATAAAVTENPFYLQITQTPDAMIKGKGGLPLITLPPGTVLFRGVRIPNIGAKEDARYFYRDFLGDPMPGQGVCMSPTHNVFFYPFPFVAFGAHDIGNTFQSMQAVVLVHPLTVICSLSPGSWVRGDAHQLTKPTDPYSRCTTFPYGCRQQTPEELERRSWDNCLNPSYAARSGVRGWMAIAQLDSLKSKKFDLKKETPPMLDYVKALESRFPGRGMEAMAWLYTDKNNNIGFPEIAAYPYKSHQGDTPIRRVLRSDQDAVRLIEKEAAADNLNYLPLAIFTQKGTVDMVKGLYDYRRLPINADTFARPAKNAQPDVEGHLNAWLNNAMSKGVKLPFYGNAKLSFDTRTGFYVFPQLLPMNLRVPVPDAAIVAASGQTKVTSLRDIPYSFLMMPLDTPEKRQLAMTYMLIFRTFYPEKFNTKFGLEKKVGVRRAMIFNRPAVLKPLFTELGLTMPAQWAGPLSRASEQFKAEKSATSAAEVAAADAATAKVTAEQPLAIINSKEASYEIKEEKEGQFSVVSPLEGGQGEAIFTRPITPEVLETLEEDDSYGEALVDAGLVKFVEEDTKTSPPYIFESAAAYAAAPADIRNRIDYYFSYIPKEERYDLQTDKVALYSVTAPSLADAQTKAILDTYKELGLGTEPIHITDATACVGGNTISFAKAGLFVNAFEISPQRARMLAHNLHIVDSGNSVNVINGDFTKLYSFIESDIVFMDPPWGGPEYKNKNTVDLMLGDMNVNDLVVMLTSLTKLVAVKAPLNYNVKGLEKALADAKQGYSIVKIIPQDRMQLLLIASVVAPAKEGGRRSFTRKANPSKRGRTQKKQSPFDYVLAFQNVWKRHAQTKET